MTLQVPNTSTSNPNNISGTNSPFFGTDVELLSADYIIWYVGQALGDIGAQLDDYKRHVDKKREKAEEIRTILAQVTDASENGQFADYDKAMQTLKSYAENDPALAGAYEHLLRSYGPYQDAQGNPVGHATDEDHGIDNNRHLNQREWSKVIDQLKQSQEALNSDNELTMMKLQTLMQQRNQVSQFASNMLNVLHENAKAVIGNIRA